MSFLKLSVVPTPFSPSGFLRFNALVGLGVATFHYLWNPAQGLSQIGLATLSNLVSIGVGSNFIKFSLLALGKTEIEGLGAVALALGGVVVVPALTSVGIRKVFGA